MSLVQSSLIQSFAQFKYNIEVQSTIRNLNQVKDIIKKRKNQMTKRQIIMNNKNVKNQRKRHQTIQQYLDTTAHKMSIQQVVRKYETNLNYGLTEEAVLEKLAGCGQNKIHEQVQTNPILLFFHEMTDPFSLFIWFLILVSFTDFSISEDTNALWLAIILLITILSGAALSYSYNLDSNKIVKYFSHIIPHFALIRRDGKVKTVKTEHIVVGDIIYLNEGCQIPSDIRILQSNDMKVDNSIFTGENDLIKITNQCSAVKNPIQSKNMVYSGSLNKSGNGIGVVINTGQNTLLAHLVDLLALKTRKQTKIESQISHYVKYMVIFSLVTGLIILICAILIGFQLRIAFMIAFGVTIACAPTILNLQVIILLTIAVKRLSKYHIICKNLNVVESLGSISCLCIDKTGTLTRNNISVSALWLDNKKYQITNEYNVQKELRDQPTFNFLHKCAILSSIAVFDFAPPISQINAIYSNSSIPNQMKETQEQKLYKKWQTKLKKQDVSTYPTIGDLAESSLIKYFEEFESIQKTRINYPVLKIKGNECRKIFNANDKYSLCLVKDEIKNIDSFLENYSEDFKQNIQDDEQKINNRQNWNICCYKKGAPQVILLDCKFIMIKGGLEILNESTKKRIKQYNIECGLKGERVLAFSMSILDPRKYSQNYHFRMNPPNFPLDEQIFLGIIACQDPPKHGIQNTIDIIRSAGIKVIMITGDQSITATSIARKCHIITANKTVNELFEEGMSWQSAMSSSDAVLIRGQKLMEMKIEDLSQTESESNKKLQHILENEEVVFARTAPEQKLMIVEILQKMGHIVGVIGDGINDSPAVTHADVGISMGSGADATRDSAGIIIADDDLNTIVAGIQQGRKLFDNLKKSICYVMTSQVSQFAPFIVLILFRIPIPVFTLLIDGIADFYPAISFAYEEGQIGIMTRRPRSQDDKLVSYKLIAQCTGWMGWSSFLCSLTSYFFCMSDFGFIPLQLFAKSNILIMLPNYTDIYNPTNRYFGNTKLQQITSCEQFNSQTVGIDWINSLHPWADIRMSALHCQDSGSQPIYTQVMSYGVCSVQQISVITGRPVCYTTQSAKYGQTAYMYANVVNQMFNLFICKTRRQSVFSQKLNNSMIYFGITVQILLSIVLSETLFMIQLIGTRDVIYRHYGITAIPFGMIQFILEEIRKFLIRNLPSDKMGCPDRQQCDCRPNWFERNTLW